jgi:uncharacterized heparinase superfamily protein
MMASIARLYHTTIHLKPVQIYGRLRFRIRRPRPKLGRASPRRVVSGQWMPPIAKRQSMYGPQRFIFLNHEGSVQSAADWNSPVQEKLWLYNLHYFDDLTAEQFAQRSIWHRDLFDRWIVENPVMQGNGWEPYPVSLRVVNWIKWALAGSELREAWITSLAIQTRWLEGRLEWHILGNHLFANAKALIFAGLFFEGPEAMRWLDKGLSILATELGEQILADGGHFELSPMYHAIILEDVLDLINVSRAFPGHVSSDHVNHWCNAADRMRRWIACMTHPDGEIAFFNDAAFGIAPERSAIEDYGGRLGLAPTKELNETVTQLDASGYIRVAKNDATVFLDVAAIGPDYLPGHSHADTLSFEFSLGINRIVVNGGTSCYGDGLQRQIERATAAHSTVEIDGKNSSDVWAGFRVGRRARVLARTVRNNPTTSVACCHNGYTILPGRPLHCREWSFPDGCLKIIDTVIGGAGRAVARFHLAPEVEVSIGQTPSRDGAFGNLRVGKRTINWQTSSPAMIESSVWHPEFGVGVPTRCITVPFTRDRIATEFAW